jgi:pyruvate/2-oxoacid:ferredoxin oxidoreductase beta subunit
MAGVLAALRARGIAGKKLLLMIGEGQLWEMGLGNVLNCMIRGDQYAIVAMNNENYAMSGYNLSSMSPLRSGSKVFLNGKRYGSVPGPLLAGFAGAKYVATATPAYPADYLAKIEKALDAMPSIVDVLCPCESGWRFPVEKTIVLSRLAVRTGLYPLWEWRTGSPGGYFRRTVRIKSRVPVLEYCSLQRRFQHVGEEDLAEMEEWVSDRSKIIDELETAFGGG